MEGSLTMYIQIQNVYTFVCATVVLEIYHMRVIG